MSLKILGFLAASLGSILGLTAGVVIWTTQNWLPPMAPVLYLASVFLVLFILLGIGWFVTTRQELQAGVGSEGESAEERGLKRLVMLASQVVLAVFALGLVSLWNVDRVRASFVDAVAESHVRLEQPLRDPSPLVRQTACEKIFQRGWVFRAKHSLIASLNDEPRIARACFEAADENGWKGVELVSATLVDGWEAEMLASPEAAAPQMCGRVPWIEPLDEMSGRRPELRLLRCAATAQADGVRNCCAASLAESDDSLVAVLGDPHAFDTETASRVFAELVQYGFRPLSLPEGRQRVAMTLGTDARDVRRWVAELGCGHLDPSTAQPDLVRGFLPLVESQTCDLSEEEQLEYASPVAWARVCQEIIDAPDDKPIEQLVCDAVQGARVEKAVDEARLRVIAALRAPFLEKDAEFVTTGLTDAASVAARGGGGGVSESVSGYRVEGSYRFGERAGQRRLGDSPFATTMADPTCEKLVFGRNTEGMGQLTDWETVETFDCERYDEDMTVDEWVEQNKPPTSEDVITGKNPFDEYAAEARKKHGAAGAQAARRGAQQYRDALGSQ